MKRVHVIERVVLLAFALISAPAPLWAVESKAGGDKPPAVTAQAAVNVNTASAEQLAAGLVGVGPAKAQAIVAHRETNGPFKDKAQLLEVKGIGEAILEQNEARITF
jgi:competence protein ComEA